MKKTLKQMLSVLVALMLLTSAVGMATPADAAQMDHTLMNFTLSDIELGMAGESVSLGIDLAMTMGCSAEFDRGMLFLSLLLSSTQASAVEVMGALEDNTMKLFAQNSMGTLPFVIELPLEDVQALVQEQINAVDMAAAEQAAAPFTDIMNSYMAFIAKSSDEAYAQMMSEAMYNALLTYPTTSNEGKEDIAVFGQTVSAEKISMTITGKEIWNLMEAVYAVTPESKALWDQMMALINESISATEASENGAVTNIMDEDIPVTFDMTLYIVDDETIRVEMLVQPDDTEESIKYEIDIRQSETETTMAMTMESTLEEAMGMVMNATEQNEGGNYALSMQFGMSIASETIGMSIDVASTEATETANGTQSLNAALTMLIEGETIEGTISYNGTSALKENAESTVQDTVYTGTLQLSGGANNEAISVSASTLVELMQMPEGPLMQLDGFPTLNILEADEETMVELQSALDSLLSGAVMSLMESPLIMQMMMASFQSTDADLTGETSH